MSDFFIPPDPAARFASLDVQFIGAHRATDQPTIVRPRPGWRRAWWRVFFAWLKLGAT
jgi:hypothetical protein